MGHFQAECNLVSYTSLLTIVSHECSCTFSEDMRADQMDM